MEYTEKLTQLDSRLTAAGITFYREEPMSRHTTPVSYTHLVENFIVYLHKYSPWKQEMLRKQAEKNGF